MSPLHAFWRLLAKAPRTQMLALLAAMILSGLTEGIGLLLLVPLLEVLGGGASTQGVAGHLREALAGFGASPTPTALLSAFVALVAIRCGVQYAREQLGTSLQHRLVDDLRLRCFAALMGVEWRWLVNTRRADHANLLLSDVSRVGQGLHFGLALLATLATLCAYLLTACLLSWSMTLLALLSGALVFGLLSGQRSGALRLGQALTVASRAMQSNVQESLAGIKLAKILGTEHRHLEHFKQTTDRLRAQQIHFAASSSLSRALFQVVGALLLAAYIYIGLSSLHTPVPELLTLVLIFSRLIPLLMAGQQHFHYWLHALPALQETDQLFAECLAAAEPAGRLPPASWPVKVGIRLQQVCFGYETRPLAALDGLSVDFPARTTTAVMGASGAGKSTLADLLMGLLAPQAGELIVDGVPIDETNRRAWRAHVAYVPQESFLFNDSVRNNLRWGQPEASDEDLRLALQRAAAEFVFDLPQGLDSIVGDGGVQLSGGERQRLALARALLKRPSLLILDEATSALDLANETRIRTAIEQLHGDLTVVIIGHRLPTLEHADQVIVLEQGNIVARGPWESIRGDRVPARGRPGE